MKLWFSQMVLGPLVQTMRKFDEVSPEGLKKATGRKTNPKREQPPSHHFQVMGTSLHSNQEMATILDQIDRYLDVWGCSDREYVIDRIYMLAEGSYIQQFKWDGGAVGNEALTDSQILAHLFCTFMDERMAPLSYHIDKPFTSQHFVMTPAKPDFLKTNHVIYQTHMNPPHFDLVMKGEKWEIAPERNNLFECLSIFVHHIHTEYNGYLDSTHLGSEKIQLLRVLWE
eukprot:TRINITY_DN3058_c0_g1_i1.p1 TRINITY_DN3058_c0_g1~~TRINITY_DN3058_c0_g1_i1.p1  ORF type:complete len:227 (-),score=42.76 TRINITY_DN3058_c0_g1_i1:22-702(-)